MFGGKTTRLLTAVERDVIRGLNVLCFKPKIDDRYSESDITTHLGAKVKAITVSDGQEIIDKVLEQKKKIDSIAIDELFMIKDSGLAAVELFRQGINVYTSTLQLSSAPQALNEVAVVFPWATEVSVCPAVCVVCGADAYYTKKTGGDPTASVEVGGADLYEPRCYQHFFQGD
jgi:thymidine kinase